MIVTITIRKEDMNQFVWTDLFKLVQTNGKGKFIQNPVENSFQYEAFTESADEAVNIAYAFLLGWKNTHGYAPEVEVGEAVSKNVQTVSTEEDSGMTIDECKAKLDEAGVQYHHKAGIDKLRKMVAELDATKEV